MLNERIKAKPHSIPSLSEFTLEIETQVHKEESFLDQSLREMEVNE